MTDETMPAFDAESASNTARPNQTAAKADAGWANIEFAPAATLPPVATAEIYATGWQSSLTRNLDIVTDSTPLRDLEIKVAPIRLHSRLPKTVGFEFPEGAELMPPAEPKAAPKPRPPAGLAKPRKHTRIKPPADLIKLEDRLYFVLQPPLEMMAANSELSFPFEPFPYQMDGIAFLFPRETAILADEMGLGKTMQAITAVRMLLLSGQLRNVLFVCPKPLVSNWVREFKQWAPEIPVTVIEGDSAKRNFIWSRHSCPVRIANYELLMRDQHILDDEDMNFDLVVLDEAQRIKNRNSTTAQIVRALPRGRSWAMTGTPIENSVEDLVNIFEFLHPGYLKPEMPLKQIREASKDFIIRRTKDKVLTDMPPKMYRDDQLELTAAQWDSYRAAEEDGVVQLEGMGETLTIQHVFELVLRLKQICNFDPSTGSSCKLERLEADMEEIAASGKKAIVFSQWVDTLDKITPTLERFGPMHYHGRIPTKKREGVIQQFKEDPSKHVILMSYGAGSVGLNLQFCEYVFLFDRWWNPAVEDQAINRAHRIGAKGAVTVTRMVAANTIEQRIHDVLEEKRELFNQLFSDNASPKQTGLSREEVFGLFNLNTPAFKKAA